MAFWTEILATAMKVKDSFISVLTTIGEVLLNVIFSIGHTIFEIAKHLYQWIDGIIDKVQGKGTVIMVPPKDTEEFLKTLKDRGKTTLPSYTPGKKRSLMVASDANGTVKVAQVASTDKGFEKTIQDSFDKGDLVEQPIEG